MNQSLKDKMPYWHFDNEIMVFEDGSLGKGYKLEGFDINCTDSEKINQLSISLEHLLTGIDEGLNLQFFYKVNSNYRDKAEAHRAVSKSAPSIYFDIQEARTEFFKTNIEYKNYFKSEVYLFVRSSKHKYSKQKFWESLKKYEPILKAEYDAFKKKFLRSSRQIQNALNHCSLNPTTLTSSEWHALCFEYFNLDRSEKLGVPKYRDEALYLAPNFSEQIALTDTSYSKQYIENGDKKFRVITLGILPEGVTYSAMIHEFTKLPFHFWLSQGIKIEDQKKELERLQLQRRIAHSMASGSKNVSDLESESKLGQIEELIRELLDGSEKLVSMNISVIIWDESIEELDNKTDTLLKAFKALNQSEGLIESFPSLDAFIGSAPGICRGLRDKKVKSSNASHLCPVYGNWQGNSTPVCLIPSRDYSLFALDPFAKELPNWNGLIFGGSGAGKSFTICQLMLQFYGQNPTPKIVWIDNGASSQRLLEVLGGEFIDLNIDSNICLNMFDLNGEKTPTTSKVKLILAALESILKDENSNGLPKRDKALLEEAIFMTYDKLYGKTPTLSDYKEVLEKHRNPEINKYAEILYSWTGNTAYGRMLDGQSNVTLSKDLITIEMKGLDTYSDLQNVFLLLFTDFIKNEAAKDTSKPYLLIIDEAWKLFETKSGLSFTMEAYRTFRKFNGGIWCISQNYKDFLSNQEIKNAVFPNTSSVFILRQRKIDWEDFQKTMDFTEDETAVVKSLELVKGEYSEFLYMQDERKIVLRLMPDPLSYWVCTTDGFDKAQIEKMKKKFPKLKTIEILKKLAYNDKEAA
ncbi:MAG: type-IV secretion system protein TraC [Bacteriovoracaceae bacterium]|jgi:type-IV secretion system protein TraC